MGATANLIGAGTQAAGQGTNAVLQSRAMLGHGRYARQVGQQNARFAALQAEDALKRGELEAGVVGERGAAIMGQERASYAAQGVDVNSGSAADVQANTAAMTARDELMARNNAARAALGFKVQALADTTQGRMASIAAREAASQTLATGGLQAARAMMYGAEKWPKAGPVNPRSINPWADPAGSEDPENP